MNRQEQAALVIIFGDTYFEGHLADTPELLKRTHRVRYQVYCLENRYEPQEQPVPGEEHDRYDDWSVAFLFTHRQSGLDVGTVRLVFAPEPEALPFRRVMGDRPLTLTEVEPAAAEVSRLAISKTFRRRLADNQAPWNLPGERPAHGGSGFHPGPVFGLLRCLYAYSLVVGLGAWYAMMEPSLARRLGLTGVVAEPLGAPISYHGRRAPYRFQLALAEGQLHQQQPQLWSYITGRDGGTVWAPEGLTPPHRQRRRA